LLITDTAILVYVNRKLKFLAIHKFLTSFGTCFALLCQLRYSGHCCLIFENFKLYFLLQLMLALSSLVKNVLFQGSLERSDIATLFPGIFARLILLSLFYILMLLYLHCSAVKYSRFYVNV